MNNTLVCHMSFLAADMTVCLNLTRTCDCFYIFAMQIYLLQEMSLLYQACVDNVTKC